MFKSVKATWNVWSCENDHFIVDLLRRYKFCPQCGGRILQRKKTGYINVCSNCKQEIDSFGSIPAYCPYCGEKGGE
jgi:DNA-directed RNA polymerase subunit RPC12/RpoP